VIELQPDGTADHLTEITFWKIGRGNALEAGDLASPWRDFKTRIDLRAIVDDTVKCNLTLFMRRDDSMPLEMDRPSSPDGKI